MFYREIINGQGVKKNLACAYIIDSHFSNDIGHFGRIIILTIKAAEKEIIAKSGVRYGYMHVK